MVLGSQLPSQTDAFGGDIAEIIIYTGDLTAPEIANIKDYLRAKYNLW
jgi:hypothetical protein